MPRQEEEEGDRNRRRFLKGQDRWDQLVMSRGRIGVEQSVLLAALAQSKEDKWDLCFQRKSNRSGGLLGLTEETLIEKLVPVTFGVSGYIGKSGQNRMQETQQDTFNKRTHSTYTPRGGWTCCVNAQKKANPHQIQGSSTGRTGKRKH